MSNNQNPMSDSYGLGGGFGTGGFGTPPGTGPSRQPGPAPKEPKGSRKNRREKAPKTSTKRLLNKQRVAALLLAGVTGLLAFTATSQPSTNVYVLRTTTQIAALSPIAASEVEAFPLPPEAIEEGAISAATPEDALKKAELLLAEGRVRMSLPKGHQLHVEDFTSDVDLTTPLRPEERILAIEANVVAAVGGQLRAGDRVDVLAVVEIEGKIVSNLVASNVEILAALPSERQFDAVAQEQVSGKKGESSSELLPADPVPGIYNVRVSLDQAVVLAAADSRGELVLVLRGKGATDAPTQPIELGQVITQPASVAPVAPTPAETTPTETAPRAVDPEQGE